MRFYGSGSTLLVISMTLALAFMCIVGPVVGSPQPRARAGVATATMAPVLPRDAKNVEWQQQQQRMYGRQQAAASTITGSHELPTAAVSIDGQPLPTTSSDPLLALMPDFAFSMPAQIVVDGINVALVSVLVIHLLFTVQYHFPLSRKNFYLQASSSVMLLISLSVTIHIILQQLEDDSKRYPFMFPYIGVQLPPGDDSWTHPEEVFYLLMRAITTALIHITHIQFLTLLFPSALEARLILWMLGPLAIINSGMEFTSLADDADLKTTDLGDAVRNICNSTLTLLYTAALLIWGLLVNRRRAWRAGGGTASFGCGSVGLALINTAISFTEIKYDRLWWLPNVCWTLTIWQSWLGFWWWVSSGMGIGEVEDRQERLERKRKREERKKRKIDKQRHKLAMLEGGDSNGVDAHSSQHDSSSIPGLNGFIRFKDRVVSETTGSNTLTRRWRRQMASDDVNASDATSPRTHRADDVDQIELNQIRIGNKDEGIPTEDAHANEGEAPLSGISIDHGRPEGVDAEGTDGHIDDGRTTAGGTNSSDTHPTASSVTGWMTTAAQRFIDHQPNFIKARFRRLRLAHVAAARRAAHEQSALRQQVLNSSRISGPGLRHMMFDRSGSLRAGMEGSSDTAGHDSTTLGQVGSLAFSPSTRSLNDLRPASTRGDAGSFRMRSQDRSSTANAAGNQARRPSSTSESDTSLRQLAQRAEAVVSNVDPNTGSQRVTTATEAIDEDWVDEEPNTQSSISNTAAAAPIRKQRRRSTDSSSNTDDGGQAPAQQGEEEGESSSWFWRGGLKQMRLRDRTTYD